MNQDKILIIGNGILGLSVAEFFSRQQYINKYFVEIESKKNLLTGSSAAAANLATKGQLFGKDPHFQMKLNGKNIYFQWLKNLCFESNTDEKEIEMHFRSGFGLDFFSKKEDLECQFNRVLQNKDDLIKKKLPTDFIQIENEALKLNQLELHCISYKNEFWVDANWLLNLLHKTLIKRNIKMNSSENGFTEHQIGISHIIYCMGAWTNSKNQFNIKLGKVTYGITCFLDEKNSAEFFESLIQIEAQFTNNKNEKKVSLYSFHYYDDKGEKIKFTISGQKNRIYFSSTTIILKDDIPFTEGFFKNEYDNINIDFKKNIHKFLKENFNRDTIIYSVEGYRIRYGHQEFLVQEICNADQSYYKKIVCAGAHKSGFLIAPVISEIVEKILMS